MTRAISIDTKIALLRQGLLQEPLSPTVLLKLAEALAEKGEAKEAADIFGAHICGNRSSGSGVQEPAR